MDNNSTYVEPASAQITRWKMFSQWLRKQRQSKGLTQAQAAQSANVSRRQWIRYESGVKVLQKQVSGIAKALNLPLNTILQRAQYKPIPGVSSGLNRMYRSLKEGDPAKAIQELLKVDAKINDRVYNEEDAKNFAEALLQLESLPKEEMERALKEATDKRRSNGQIIIRDSVSMEPETAKRKYKKGQAVRFSAKAPERWKQAMKRGTGKSFPATDKCVVVGFSPRDPKIVYVLQEFRKSPLRISMEFIEPDNKGT